MQKRDLLSSVVSKLPGILVLVVAFASVAFAWTGPTGTAPSNNTPPPINTSATAQTKAGGINFQNYAHFTGYGTDSWFPYTNGANYLRGPLYFNSALYDENNAGYYLDPNGTSRMGQVNADNTYTYGNENANDYYIRASGKWASQLGGGVSSVGLSCYDAAASCWPGSGTKTDRYCQVCVNGVCSGYTNTGSIRDACDYGGWY